MAMQPPTEHHQRGRHRHEPPPGEKSRRVEIKRPEYYTDSEFHTATAMVDVRVNRRSVAYLVKDLTDDATDEWMVWPEIGSNLEARSLGGNLERAKRSIRRMIREARA